MSYLLTVQLLAGKWASDQSWAICCIKVFALSTNLDLTDIYRLQAILPDCRFLLYPSWHHQLKSDVNSKS